jgi:hypothetical protein
MKTDTPTLISAMRHLAATVQCDDGIANAAIAEAADRLAELTAEKAAIERLKSALRDLVEYSQPLEYIGEDESHNARRVAINLLDELEEKNTHFSPQNKEFKDGE